MQMWNEMPRGVTLKSLGFATSITAPGVPTFPEYCRAHGLEDYEPIERRTFAEYGMQVQSEFVPYVEDTRVTDVRQVDDRFLLTLETGERVHARRVVVATGLHYLAHIPEVLAGLPTEYVTHTAHCNDMSALAGKDVVVVGGGASALETAVLLHENGSRVTVLARHSISFGGRGPREWERPLLDRIRVPISSIGHGRDNWVLEHVPMLMHFMPAHKRLPFTRKHLGPASAWWLRDRAVGKVDMHQGTTIEEATLIDGKVTLRVKDAVDGERCIQADHVVAGTGYQPDVDRISFIAPELARMVARWDRAPRLDRHFQSSVPGLYFIGPIAAQSFGPLVRFVAGSSFMVRAVAGHLARPANPLVALTRRMTSVDPRVPERVAPQAEI
jgi:cation diffusion facilitator CzcD-associated flavoprotein CzcO